VFLLNEVVFIITCVFYVVMVLWLEHGASEVLTLTDLDGFLQHPEYKQHHHTHKQTRQTNTQQTNNQTNKHT
jgi:hypothetical protein